MKIRNTKTRLVAVLAFSIIFPNVAPARTLKLRQSQGKDGSIAKAVQLLQDSGFTHRKTGNNTWVIERDGKTMLMATGEEFLVLGIIVAVKKNMRVSPDLEFKLLKLNHTLDYVKVGFDEDDDLFVRTEARMRQIDLAAFKAMVEDVGAGAVKAQNEVKPFLVNP